MKTVTVTIKGESPYSASRMHAAPKLDKESHDDYEKRTWREKAHVIDGLVIIPGLQLKKAIDSTAKHFSETIRGKGKKTWTRFFESGTMPLTDIALGVRKEDLEPETIYVNADGRRGGSTRVWRTFPVVTKWGGEIEIAILDDTIITEIFERYCREAGRFNGLGRWRPQNGGMNGRFSIVSFEWAG